MSRSTMQHCPHCGNHNLSDSIFCSQCGHRLNNRCVSCGFQNLETQEFCGNCGRQVTGNAPKPTLPPHAAPPRSPGPPPEPSVSSISYAPSPAGANTSAKQSSPSAALPGLFPGASPPVPTDAPSEPPTSGISADDVFTLNQYGLLSIETTAWDMLTKAGVPAEQLGGRQQEWVSRIERLVVQEGGVLHVNKRKVLFIAFSQEPSLTASLIKAVQFARHLIQTGNPSFPLRFGLDVESASARNPLTSTLERMTAKDGQILISEPVYSLLAPTHIFQLAGLHPVTIGGKPYQFYRVLSEEETTLQLPDPEDCLIPEPETLPPTAPPPHTQPSVQSSAKPAPPLPAPAPAVVESVVHPMIEPEPIRSEAEEVLTPMPAVQAEPPTPAADIMSTVPAATIPPEMPQPVDQPSAPQIGSSQIEPPKVESKAESKPLPRYTPPVFGEERTARTGQLSYNQAIESLQVELTAFLTECKSAGVGGKIVTLAAPDGLGKSTILHMVRSQLDPEGQRAVWLGGTAYKSFSTFQGPLLYWLELLQNMMSLVPEGQPAATAQPQIETFLSYLYGDDTPEDIHDFLMTFLSVQPPQPLNQDTPMPVLEGADSQVAAFFYLFFKQIVQKRPLIVVMEDAHLMDTVSLEVLHHLIREGLMALPVCMVMTMTPTFYLAGPLQPITQKAYYRELTIRPLDQGAAEQFLNDGPLGGNLHAFPVSLMDSLLRYAQGCPLYMEEGLRLLHLRSVIQIDEHSHKFRAMAGFTLEEAFLPEQVEGIVRERMDYLAESTRFLLQLASILGERFSVSLLMALAQMPEADFNDAMMTLFNHGYLIPDAVNTGRFRHTRIWQAVYEAQDHQWKTQMHQLISQVMEEDFQQGMTVNSVRVAYHAEKGDLSQRALEFWNLTGVYQARVGCTSGLNIAMHRALAYLRTNPEPLHEQEMALRIVETLGIANVFQAPEQAIDWLEWVIYYRRAQGETTRLLEPLGSLSAIYESKGNYSKALDILNESIPLVNPQTHPLESMSLYVTKMEHLIALGRYQDARRVMVQQQGPMEALSKHLENEPDTDALAVMLQTKLIQVQVFMAQCSAGVMPLLNEVIESARIHNLTPLALAAQITQSQAMLRLGQYEACNRDADNLLHAIQALDEPTWFLSQWGLLSMLYHCDLEMWDSASELTLAVIGKADEARDYVTAVMAQALAGQIAVHLGKQKEGRQLLEKALQQASDQKLSGMVLLCWRFLAEHELLSGNAPQAAQWALKALDLARRPEILNHYEEMQLSLVLVRAQLAQEQLSAAGKQLESLWQHVAKSKVRPLIALCAAEIGTLYKKLAQDAPPETSKTHLMRSTEFFLKAKSIWLEIRHMPNVKRIDAAIPRV